MSSNFHAKATAAAAKISSLSPEELLAQTLAQDRPTIDSAIKSFLSLTAARSLAKAQIPLYQKEENYSKELPCCRFSSEDPRMSALKCSRVLLREVNNLELPEQDSTTEDSKFETADNDLEYNVVRAIWNGLIASEKKPSKFLGRISLLHAYPIILQKVRKGEVNVDDVLEEEAVSFFEEFDILLQRKNMNKNGDDDSALLWEKDRGAVELSSRRDRREKSKNDALDDAQQGSLEESLGPIIEEINEEQSE